MRRLKDHASKSNWTPCTHAPSKEEIFQERMKLMTNWFDMWTHQQRSHFFDHFLERCDRRQLAAVEKFFVEKVPLERIDFTKIFPRHLSLFVFSFLDPKSLSRAAAVSWHWKFLAEQDALWIPKCTRHAWYLPYNPPPYHLGSWKRHYIACIRTLDFKISEGKESLWFQQQEEKRRQNVEKQVSNKSQKLWKAIEKSIKDKSLETRGPWVPSNKFPEDLLGREDRSKRSKKNWDLVYESFGLDSDPGSRHVSKWKETKDALLRMNDSDVKILTEQRGSRRHREHLSEELKVENLKERRITELKDFQNRHPRFWDPASIVESSLIPLPCDVTTEFYRRSEVSKVIFISSEVPSHDVLVCSLLPDVVHLSYDFNSTTLDSLLFRLHSLIEGGPRPHLIGFFLHQKIPGDLLLTKDLKLTPGEPHPQEVVKFFKVISGLLIDGGCVDAFQPMASCEEFVFSEEGRCTLAKLSSICGVGFRSPTNILHKYDFYGTQWFSTSPSKTIPTKSPWELYFNEEKFIFWWNEVELMEEACGKVSACLDGYFEGVRKRMTSRAIGRIMFDKFGFGSFENLKKILKPLTDGLEALRDSPEEELLSNLGKHLQSCHQHETKVSEVEDSTENWPRLDADKMNKTSTLNKTNRSSLLEMNNSGDEGIDNDGQSIGRQSLQGKTRSHDNFHPGTASPVRVKNVFIHQSDVGQLQVLDGLIASERYHSSCLRSLIEVFKEPIMASLETNRALISWQNARLLFDDVTQFFGISCQFLEDSKLTRNKQPSKISLGQLFLRFLKSFQSLLSSYLLIYPSILETYDKCKRQKPQFRAFLKRFKHSLPSLMLSMPELYARPWKRVDEYSKLLTAYKDAIPKDHSDIHDINSCFHPLGELLDLIGENIKRINLSHQMETIQERIKNCPQLQESGRHLLKEIEVAHLVAPCDSVVPELRVYRHIGDLHFCLFDDCLLCSSRIVSSIPFGSRVREELVFQQTSSLKFIRIDNIPDSPYIKNGFKMWTPRQEWICSVRDGAMKFDWISNLKQTILLYLNNS